MTRSGTLRVHLLALGALCAVTFFIGLTTHGLTNWQEAQRALVARDMARRGDWLVPTVNGEPYLAKPPMIYWAQLALAKLRGTEPGELDLRLTVALAASLGVFCTYLAGRRILASALPPEAGPQAARTGAFWAAAMLGTGILYVRSGRIGELDILMVPFIVGAVGWVWWARERAESRGPGTAGGLAALGIRSLAALPMALPAAILATGAALTKGPPGVLVIALAVYFPAILIHHRAAEGTEGSPGSERQPGGGSRRAAAPPNASLSALCASVVKTGPRAMLGALLGLLVAALATVFISSGPTSIGEWLGVIILTAGLAWLGWVLGRANWPAVLREWSITHPLVVLGLPMLALLGWGRLVGDRIGAEAVARAAGQEASENLQLWVLESPLRTLEGASYGVGLGSVMAIITAIWLVRRKFKVQSSKFKWGPGAAVIVGWTIVSLLAFAALGKGPARYLTPVWPGIALAGGLGVALLAETKRKAKSEKRKFGGRKHKAESSTLKSAEEMGASGGPGSSAGVFAFRFSFFAFDAQTLRIVLTATITALAVAQGLWYGYAREALYAWRSPRALMAEIMAPDVNPEQAPPLALDIWTPALDYYARAHVQPYFSGGPSVAIAGVRPRPLEHLRAELLELEEDGQSPWRIMLIRTTPHPEGPEMLPIERLQQAGLMVQTLPVASEFRIDNNRTEVIAVRVAPAPSAPSAR